MNTLRSIGGLLAPVVGEEELLEVRLLDRQGGDPEPGGRLDQAVGAARQPASQHGAVDPDVLEVRQPAECLDRHGLVELDLDPTDCPPPERFDRLDGDELAVADDPDPVGALLDLAQDVRRHEHGLPGRSRLGDELEEPLLDDRVQAARRLVEDEELGLVHERLHDADLLPIALGQLADPRRHVEVEATGQCLDPVGGNAAAQVAEVGQQLATGLAAGDGEVAGQVADPPAQRGAALSGRFAEQRRHATRRADQVEQDPDRGGLAGAVGSQEAVDLAFSDIQVEPGEAASTAVGLRERLGSNQFGHRSDASLSRCRSAR